MQIKRNAGRHSPATIRLPAVGGRGARKMQEMLTAITRAVSPTMAACELTYREREAIDIARAREQHRAYETCLAELGVEVISLGAEPDYPDAVFVEDAGVVLDLSLIHISEPTRLGMI